MDILNAPLIMFIVVMVSMTLTEIFPRNRCNQDEIDYIKRALDKLEDRIDTIETKQ